MQTPEQPDPAMTATAPAPTPTRPPRSTGRRVLAVTVVVAGLLLLLAGLDRVGRETTTTSETLDATGIRAIVVGTSAGEVSVVATDRADIEVVARATSGLFSDADVAVTRTGDRVGLVGDCDGLHAGSCRVAFEVQVPRDLHADVDVHATAGRIVLRGMTEDVAVRTTAGEVELHDFAGTAATVTTTAGSIQVDASAATRSLDLRTTAGEIDVRIDDTEPLRVDVDTTVGSESVSVNQSVDADRTVTARTTAGEITVAGR